MCNLMEYSALSEVDSEVLKDAKEANVEGYESSPSKGGHPDMRLDSIRERNRRHAKACRERNKTRFVDLKEKYSELLTEKLKAKEYLDSIDCAIALTHLRTKERRPSTSSCESYDSDEMSDFSGRSMSIDFGDHADQQCNFSWSPSPHSLETISSSISASAEDWIESIRATVRDAFKEQSASVVEDSKTRNKSKMDLRRVRNRVHAKFTRLRSMEVTRRMQDSLNDLNREVDSLRAGVSLRLLAETPKQAT